MSADILGQEKDYVKDTVYVQGTSTQVGVGYGPQPTEKLYFPLPITLSQSLWRTRDYGRHLCSCQVREGASGPQRHGDPDPRQTRVPILSPVLNDVLYGTHCTSWH